MAFVGVFFLSLLIGFSVADSIGGFLVAIPIALLIAILVTVIVGFSQKDQRAAADAHYDRLWYCSKCGNQFEVDLENVTLKGSAPGPTAVAANGIRADFASRVLSPVQRAKTETPRDREWLKVIRDRTDSTAEWAFDPCLPTPLDLGVVSRLSSLGFLEYDAHRDIFSLSKAGLSRLD